jgi:uncharacterized protein YcbX
LLTKENETGFSFDVVVSSYYRASSNANVINNAAIKFKPMKEDPILSRITIYPVKSLDGVSLQKSEIIEGGCLLHDREYAIIDEKRNFIIGKTNALVHTLRSDIDIENETISFRENSIASWTLFHLRTEKSAIESYLSNHFGKTIILVQDNTGRFMDIPDISGLTILSTSSLNEISTWYNLNIDETRKRFRATLEIEGVPAFWEDRLFTKDGTAIEFKVGDVTLFGMSPRARCVVPTRNPESGDVIHGFPKSFARHRAATLPKWSNLGEYGHHYYLTVNCFVPATEIGKTIEVGNKAKIIGEKRFN